MLIDDIRHYIFPLYVGVYPKDPDQNVQFVRDDDGFLGTGFFITKNGVALTAAHCMPKPESVGEKTVCAGLWDGTSIRAHRVLSSVQFGSLDIALIKIENVASRFLSLSFEQVYMGEDVSTVGFPMHSLWGKGLEVRVLKGHVTFSGHFLELSFAVPRGMSGSAVLRGDKVAGVLQGNARSETLEDQVEEITKSASGQEVVREIVKTKAIVNYGLAEQIRLLRDIKHEVFNDSTFEQFVNKINQA